MPSIISSSITRSKQHKPTREKQRQNFLNSGNQIQNSESACEIVIITFYADILILKLKEIILLLSQTRNIESVQIILSQLFSPTTYTFKQIIEANLFSQMTVEELAQQTNLSISSLKREFSVPTINETFIRVPIGNPLAKAPIHPVIAKTLLAFFILFIAGSVYQFVQQRKVNKETLRLNI